MYRILRMAIPVHSAMGKKPNQVATLPIKIQSSEKDKAMGKEECCGFQDGWAGVHEAWGRG